MTEEELARHIDGYLEREWETVVNDIDALVRVESTEDLRQACEGAPFGPGPRRALDVALGIAERMGFATCDGDGYVGYADYVGTGDGMVGVIGHVDVVPAGSGWTVDPFSVTRRDGYVLGRGVLDDKGPTVVALHAVNALKCSEVRLSKTVRMMFGTNEETGMNDVSYYLARHRAPDFLFTPDADFPVGYGEKGQLDVDVAWPMDARGALAGMEGGMARNAVPDVASAVVRSEAADLPTREGVTTEALDGAVRVTATGVGGHAAFPEGTSNAIGLLAAYLLEAGLLSPDERGFLGLVAAIAGDHYGATVGIDAEDEHFGKLTIAGSTVRQEGGRLVLSVDCRYPMSTSKERLLERLRTAASACGADVRVHKAMEPFFADPSSWPVKTLQKAYEDVAGERAEPFTMGGGTYARHFPTAASFGPNCPWVQKPDWVGEEHCADEGVAEALLKQALKVYAIALARLAE